METAGSTAPLNLEQRPQGSATQPQGPLTIDEAGREAFWQGRRLDLTPTEFAVLACLYQRAGQIVPNDALLQEVWGASLDKGGTLCQVRNTVKRLRRKLAAVAGHSCQIVSVRGVGYRLDLPSGRQGTLAAHRHRSIALRIALALVIVTALAAVAARWLLAKQIGGDPTTLVWYGERRVLIGVLWAMQRGQHCVKGPDGELYCFDTPEECESAIDVLLREATPQGQE